MPFPTDEMCFPRTPEPQAPALEPAATTSAAPAATVPARWCAIGAGCVAFLGRLRASWGQQQQHQAQVQHPPTAVEVPAVAAPSSACLTYPNPQRTRRLTAQSRARSNSEPSTSSSARLDMLDTILEHMHDGDERRPSLLGRLQRALGGGGSGKRIFGHGYSMDDGYDSEEDEEISEALFIEVKGDLAAARRRNFATLRWRDKHGMDETLDDPHPELEGFLAASPRWLQGTAKDGSILWYEKLGQMDLGRGGHRHDHNAWVKHVGLICEYVTRCLDPYHAWNDPYATMPGPKVTVVWDLEGMGAAKWADPAVRKAVRAWGNVLAAHYPGLVVSILVVNAPQLSVASLALLQPLTLLPSTLRATVRMVGKGTGQLSSKGGRASSSRLGGGAGPLEALTEAIDAAVLPVAYAGGENPQAPESAAEWKGLLRLLRRNRRYYEYVRSEQKAEAVEGKEDKADKAVAAAAGAKAAATAAAKG